MRSTETGEIVNIRKSRFTLERGAAVCVVLCALSIIFPGHVSAAVARGAITEWGRTLERLMIVACGALSMLYGYKLFSIVAGDTGELTAKAGGWHLKLARIGPGVFFAFFGAAVLVFTMSQSPSIVSASPDGQVTEVHGVIPVDTSATDVNRDALRALTTFSRISVSGTPTQQELTQMKRAIDKLEPMRQALIDVRFGVGAYAEWSRLHQIQQLPGSDFANAMKEARVRQRFNDVDAALSEAVE
jgi:hypothetical protein